MEMKCQHCGHEWNYKGKAPFYASCPRCRFKVKVPRDEEPTTE